MPSAAVCLTRRTVHSLAMPLRPSRHSGFVVILATIAGCGGSAAVDVPQEAWKATPLTPSAHRALHPVFLELPINCSNLAVADLDGDAQPEVFVGDGGGGLLFVSPASGRFLRVSRETARTEVVPPPTRPSGPGGLGSKICPLGVADLDGDDVVDLLYATNGQLSVLLRGANPRVLRAAVPEENLSFGFVLDGPPGAPPMVVVGGTGSELTCETCATPGEAPTVTRSSEGNWEIRFARGFEPGSRLHAWTFEDGSLRPVESPALTPSTPLMIQGGAVRRGADGWDEAVLSADFRAQFALRRGAAGLTDVSEALGVAHYAHGMGNLFGDVDEDGVDDLVVSTLGVMFFRGLRGGGFELDVIRSPFARRERVIGAWGGVLQDLDNNGHLDLALSVSGAERERPARVGLSMLWRYFGGPVGDGYHPIFFGQGGGSFSERWLPFDAFGPEAGRAFSMTTEDLDQDGRLELLVSASQPAPPSGAYLFRPDWMRVEASPDNVGHGLTVRLPPRLGRVGTRASLRCSNGRVISREVYGADGAGGPWRPMLHFGCGAADRFTELTLLPRDRPPVYLGSGALDRAVACDERGCVTVPPPDQLPLGAAINARPNHQRM